MSQRNWTLSFILIISSLLLAGCMNKVGAVSVDTSDTIRTTIIGGRTGGAWSVFTEGIAESVRREHKGSLITVEPGGIVENPASVGTNTVPYGISYAMTAYAAFSGTEPYKEAYPDIRAISVVIPANYYQLIARGDVEFDSLDEAIKKKAPIRLAVDQRGSAGEIMTRAILREYGVSYQDIDSWGGSVDHLSGSTTFELMADNRIDLTGDAVSVPSSDILEASTTNDLKFISMNQNILQAVAKKLGMEQGTITSGSYDFLVQDVSTVYTPAILIVHKDVPEEEVYRVTKAIYENFEYLSTVHKEFKNLSEKNFSKVGKVPLHPGAEKFLKEKGLIPEF
ncbi:TAXI family TRAP transporter solute-binding subunit [Bacillus timonensis]|uniref:TAXI family TRAP transporter solute-binding subunit n=1 Tax=Bacillus timonensis TaxID=1033734 RepID=A0A4S3PUY1_9BACI|nr:TAXI family TRAP transporter solute-binding subunit [Bacillus timonensis]THE13304.1 TAXI family TRAP transporter solute-binding subunit [Bacillus timonensis]